MLQSPSGSGGTPRGFVCPGRSGQTPAPDYFRCVHVCVGLMSTPLALEVRLGPPVFRAGPAALGAGLAGALGWHWNEHPVLPTALVLKFLSEQVPALAQNLPVESSLLPDLPCRLGHPPVCGDRTWRVGRCTGGLFGSWSLPPAPFMPSWFHLGLILKSTAVLAAGGLRRLERCSWVPCVVWPAGQALGLFFRELLTGV